MQETIVHFCRGCDQQLDSANISMRIYKKTVLLICSNLECLLYGQVMKLCTTCDIPQPHTEEYFYKRSNTKDRFLSNCKKCHTAITSAKFLIWQKEHPEQTAVHCKTWRDKNPEKVRGYRQKDSALRRQRHPEKFAKKEQLRRDRRKILLSDFTVEQWNQALTYFNDTCAYCGKQQTFWNVLEQEHIIAICNGGDYTASNIVPACKSCNSSKNNKHLSQWLISKFGKRKATKTLSNINSYLETLATENKAVQS